MSSWKAWRQVIRSKTEDDVFALLPSKLKHHAVTGKTYTLQEETEEQPKIQTIPDVWINEPFGFVYYDGDVHCGKRLDKDDTVNFLLEKNKVPYIRVRFHGSPSRKRVEEMAQEIVDFFSLLEKRGSEPVLGGLRKSESS